MPKFIRKPVIVEANQYLGEESVDILGVCNNAACNMAGSHIHTFHSLTPVLLEKGDWVLPDGHNEFYYPVKDKIFRDAYEPLSEPSA